MVPHVQPVPSEQPLCLACGAVAITRLTWQLAAPSTGKQDWQLVPFFCDANPWLEGTLEKAAQGACEGLCLQDGGRINSLTVIFPLLRQTNTPVKHVPLSSLLRNKSLASRVHCCH